MNFSKEPIECTLTAIEANAIINEPIPIAADIDLTISSISTGNEIANPVIEIKININMVVINHLFKNCLTKIIMLEIVKYINSHPITSNKILTNAFLAKTEVAQHKSEAKKNNKVNPNISF